ncbi:MAG: Uncharacterized protein conserved in bacteria, NMA0228-like [uncultured Thiotrichaceae bacterium]|uniref:Uncharacterized protein conserved in bacteria, NMA0228-like n=1 Tax=uncultured Thiotrichaceae bacterium TaxID=298394 RepID=A0A6S6T7J2_9GAMM|nr:MAG: Uncharacterized protein conserved in bacteria, NMA0228-like [uncultured Thiotrichaceae bacterium]
MQNTQATSIQHQAGIGLRSQHINQILDNEIAVPWFELLVDNWLADGGLTRRYLDVITERYPLTLHGVGLSLGGTEPLDFSYLQKIKDTLQHTDALWYSEHLCFSQLQSHFSHDLLPLPYTEEAITHVVERIQQVQDFLGRQILIENVSAYLEYQHSRLSESEFITEIADAADCKLILDVNNFYVNQINHKHDALTEIQALPNERVEEIHLAGFADKGEYVVDAHNNPVAQGVWDLYEETLKLTGPVPTLIEWDNDIPELDILLAEKDKAQNYLNTHLTNTKQQCA